MNTHQEKLTVSVSDAVRVLYNDYLALSTYRKGSSLYQLHLTKVQNSTSKLRTKEAELYEVSNKLNNDVSESTRPTPFIRDVSVMTRHLVEHNKQRIEALETLLKNMNAVKYGEEVVRSHHNCEKSVTTEIDYRLEMETLYGYDTNTTQFIRLTEVQELLLMFEEREITWMRRHIPSPSVTPVTLWSKIKHLLEKN